ncbi:hypothetical protein HG536_0E01400 [Torulaspora globosa]|uniref:C2H2-type domain-containing protein n=1 Tax=Torulaspora globosa TaxID=48254 RepID=A0A7G3ZI93_9SACH|nr:uncharacterized protein HG536_0E01400 [Torulaspora globosa]QLL33229.1 hypothetical protein HG536_0E01400 [Torulaspora globosa]
MLAMATSAPTSISSSEERKAKTPVSPGAVTATANSSKPAGSLAQFHQPFVSSPTPFSSSSQVTLPPISSFDNLIRAAEKQYSNSSKVASPGLVSPGILSYQLSATDTACNTTVPRSVMQRPSSVVSKSSSGSPSFSSGEQPYGSKVHKPRKKKQCPICHNFYANLSTHKSTHLTPEDRPHKCPVCQRGFARNNDLIRHKKRHWRDEIVENSPVEHSDADEHVAGHTHLDEHDQLRSLHQIKGTFKCPFNSALIQLDMEIYPYKSKPLNFETSNCHQTGVFSRCDTFKNHLKALHFEYPPGTKKRDRTVVPGRCKHCGLKFPNVDIWLNEHVGKTCGYTYH